MITFIKQECIPVGCVLSAALAVSPATHAPCHACQLHHATSPFAIHTPFATHAPFITHGPSFATHDPAPLPLNRITDMCKNITFPQLLLRTVINTGDVH